MESELIVVLSGILSITIIVTFFVMAHRLGQLVKQGSKKDEILSGDDREQRVIDSFIEARINEMAGYPQEALKHYVYCYYNFFRSTSASFQVFGESISTAKLKKKIAALAGKPIVKDRKDFTI